MGAWETVVSGALLSYPCEVPTPAAKHPQPLRGCRGFGTPGLAPRSSRGRLSDLRKSHPLSCWAGPVSCSLAVQRWEGRQGPGARPV